MQEDIYSLHNKKHFGEFFRLTAIGLACFFRHDILGHEIIVHSQTEHIQHCLYCRGVETRKKIPAMSQNIYCATHY